MAEKITYVNPQMLQWARIESGTKIEYVASRIGGIEKIKAWEHGEDYPTYSQLKDLCKIYRKPVAIFFFPEPPQMKNLSTSYRTLQESVYSSFSRKLIKVIDEARVMQLNLYELNDGINTNIPKFINYNFSIKQTKSVAIELRELLEIDLTTQKKVRKLEEAFELWRDRFYKLGIYVFKDAFQDETVSGFCLYDSEFPVIYINNSFAPSRQIFTLFHEAYHLICQTSGIDFLNDSFLDTFDNVSSATIEKTCNRFAGEILVPDDDFDKLTNSKIPTESFISELSNTYSVSREVILRKFLDRRKITEEEYQQKRDEYNSDYFRSKAKKKESSGDYYNTQAVYKGKHYLELAYGRYYSNKISLFQLSRYLNMKIPSIEGLATRKGWGTI